MTVEFPPLDCQISRRISPQSLPGGEMPCEEGLSCPPASGTPRAASWRNRH